MAERFLEREGIAPAAVRRRGRSALSVPRLSSDPHVAARSNTTRWVDFCPWRRPRPPCPTSTVPRSSCPRPTPARATGPVPRARRSWTTTSTSPTAYAARSTTGRGVSTVVARSARRRPLRDRQRGVARRVRRRVVRATGRAADPRRHLAALRLLRDPRQQALVDRGDRRRPTGGLRDRSAHRRPVRLRHGRREGPRDRRRRRRRLARLDLRAPADRGGPRGPDVDGVPPQRRRPGLGATRHRPRAPARRLGRPRGAGQRPWSASTRWSCCTTVVPAPRTTGTRRPASRGRPTRATRAPSSWPTTPSRCARRTPTAPAATPPR